MKPPQTDTPAITDACAKEATGKTMKAWFAELDALFAAEGKGRTGITLDHTRIQERGEADVLRAGWSMALDALEAHLERQ